MQISRIKHYGLTNVDACFYFYPIGPATTGGHRFLQGLPTFYQNYFFDSGKSDDRIGRNRHCCVCLIGYNFGLYESAGTQTTVVSHVSLDGKNPVLFANRRTESFDTTRPLAWFTKPVRLAYFQSRQKSRNGLGESSV